MRFIWVTIIALTLATTTFAQRKTLDPLPVPATPPPAVEPPPVVPSTITLPVTSTIPAPSIVDDEVCDFYKGHVDYVDILPPVSASADFEIWREKPLSLSLSGNTLTASVHAYYWMIGVFAPLGVPIFGECGAQGPGPQYGDEPTRELIATLDSRIKWHPDWRLTTDTTVRPFNNLNRCIVTAAHKDITDHFNRAGEGFLRRGAAKFDQRVGELSDAKSKATEMWLKLQEPLPVDRNVWLLVQPTAAGAGDINVTGQLAQTTFGLTAQPKVVVGASPTPGSARLPPLEPLTAGPDGLNINADVEVSFAEANQILQDPRTGVIGATFQSGRRELKIEGARLYGSGTKIALELEVSGRAIRSQEPKVVDVVTAVEKAFKVVRYWIEKKLYKLKGKIFFVATPQYLTDKREVIFPDLEYDIQTRNIIVKVANWILKTRLTEQLRANVKFPLGDKLDTLKSSASAAMNRPLGSHATLSGQIDTLRIDRIFIAPAGINGRVALKGTAALAVDWK
jgi:Domain of unknown function (DUF4403)